LQQAYSSVHPTFDEVIDPSNIRTIQT